MQQVFRIKTSAMTDDLCPKVWFKLLDNKPPQSKRDGVRGIPHFYIYTKSLTPKDVQTLLEVAMTVIAQRVSQEIFLIGIKRSSSFCLQFY